MARSIVIDASPVVAFIDKSDDFHNWTIEVWQKIPIPLLTCEAVINVPCLLSHLVLLVLAPPVCKKPRLVISRPPSHRARYAEGGDSRTFVEGDAPILLYNEGYQALRSWGCQSFYQDMIKIDERVAGQEQASCFDLATYLQEQKLLVEEALDRSVPIEKPEKIYEAMRYSLLAGGKRLRPILCLTTCNLAGGTQEMAMPTACALEMIHTMSLIHDDLPAMDNDDYRRGKLTNHKVYGEDIAILAGDGLLAHAFEYVATQTRNVPASRILAVIARLGRTVGAAGLVGGQVLDLESEGKADISVDTLSFIHTHKTGALLETAVVSGAILAGAASEDIERLSRYAQKIGLAFQIVDDILDITATQEELGKTAGKDVQAQKATYPSLWGIEESRVQAMQLIEGAIAELAPYGDKAEPLRAIANFILNRKH